MTSRMAQAMALRGGRRLSVNPARWLKAGRQLTMSCGGAGKGCRSEAHDRFLILHHRNQGDALALFSSGTGHVLPIWQPCIGSSFQQWLADCCPRGSAPFCCFRTILRTRAPGPVRLPVNSKLPVLPPPTSVYLPSRPVQVHDCQYHRQPFAWLSAIRLSVPD
jgi:hypothetical protein